MVYELSIGTKIGDLDLRNGGCQVISPNSTAFQAHYIKVVEDAPTLSAAEM